LRCPRPVSSWGWAGPSPRWWSGFGAPGSIERQQLKWFTYAAALAPLPFFAYEYTRAIWPVLQALILPLVPISVGIAILRYRL
jgi:hypothetical protein